MDIDWPTTIPYKLQQTCYAKTTSCKEKSKKKTNFFCHLLRADPNVLLIKAETTRPHYSSSLSLSRRFCCPLFNATREQSFELLPVTLVHAFYIFLLSPEPFTLPSLLPRQAVSVHLIVSSLRSRGLHYTRGPQHTVPMATRSLTIYAVCLLIPFRLDLSNFSSF